MPRRVKYPYVQRNRDGRCYLRKPGIARVRLPGTFGSHEFEVAYFAAIAAKPAEIGVSRTPRSMNALIVAYYAAAEFKGLRASTSSKYRGILERFREEHGDKDAGGMRHRHIRNLMTEKAATPDAANHLLCMLSTLMELAIALGWREDNPAVGIKRSSTMVPGSRRGQSPISRSTVIIIRPAPASGLSLSWLSGPHSVEVTLCALAGGMSSTARL
jgi:hypothetical protein